MAGHARSSRQGFPGTQGQATATRQRQGKVRHSAVGWMGGDIEGAGGGLGGDGGGGGCGTPGPITLV